MQVVGFKCLVAVAGYPGRRVRVLFVESDMELATWMLRIACVVWIVAMVMAIVAVWFD
jgi:hypothetical protein